MLRLLYSLAFYLLIPFAFLRLLWRSRKEPLYRATLRERFGFCTPVDEDSLVWVHSVSAGETNAAAPLINRLLDRGLRVLVTTMTPTGRQRVEALFGHRVSHCYAPYDLPGAVARFLGRTNPAVLVVIDTELWPNMIRHAHVRGTRILLVNARMSEKSARGYSRVASLTRQIMSHLDVVAAQTEVQGERFVALGLEDSKLVVAGSMKFDIDLPDDITERAGQLRTRTAGRRIVLGASIHPGEDEFLLDAFLGCRQQSDLLVIAPRHVRRVASMVELCEARQLAVSLHSQGEDAGDGCDVYMVDTMGELLYFYAIADVAVVGGSLIDGVGGHNPMEPASLDVPVIMGPFLRNIEDIAGQFRGAGAMIVVDGKRLGAALRGLLEDRVRRQAQVENARQVMAANRGALDRVEQLVLENLA